ncbi:hypothetical protein Tco_1487638 [Tanacetum coccineum]
MLLKTDSSFERVQQMKKIEAVKELSEVCDVEYDDELDDGVSGESAARWALRRAILQANVITGRNPNVLFLAVVRMRLRTVGEAIMTGVDMSQAGGACHTPPRRKYEA